MFSHMRKVRMLLRVSSNQQLEADGDLSVQRQLVTEYIQKQKEWKLDEKEYFEGSNSGYKNAVIKRETLQEALADAQKHEYDILVAYKDDRVGRRMWEMGAYIMALKGAGVDVYTVKDGCISPESDDVMGQMMLALRYGNAQKSSSDTGMRVKDTAQKLVQKGKFMGGAAPYGYELVLSGELSKHGRALHKLKVIPEQAETVKYIYNLSLNKEYGSVKIARILNEDGYYKKLAPRDVWKSGTVTSILTNPVYAGFVAYKRRERINGQYHRLESKDWIRANEPDESIRIIDGNTWDRVQERRRQRSSQYRKKTEDKETAYKETKCEKTNIIRRNEGGLALIDVLHCGYCGYKMTNGSKYNYWKLKGTGEKRSSRTPAYRCQAAHSGIAHPEKNQFRANEIETVVFSVVSQVIGGVLEEEDIFEKIRENQQRQRKTVEADLRREKQELDRILKGIEVMENHIPDAITGNCAMSLEELMDAIRKQKEREKAQKVVIKEKEERLEKIDHVRSEWSDVQEKNPTWEKLFVNAETQTKRVLVNKLIGRIDVQETQIVMRFKIGLSEYLCRISSDSGVQE